MKLIYFLLTITFCFSDVQAQLNLELLTDGKANLGSGEGLGLLHLGWNSSTSFPTLRLTEEGDDFARISFENDQTPDKYWTLAGRQKTADKDSRFYFYYRNSESGGSNLMSLTGEGRLGINKSNPTAHLDVNGAIKMSMNVAPDAEGMIRYNSVNKNFEGYNGIDWKSLTEPVPPPPPSYAIGDYEDEGVVFWISPDEKIVKFIYIGQLANPGPWSTPANIDVSDSENNFSGLQNTLDIINDPSITSSVAEKCHDLVAGGHSDWYMPSINELEQLIIVKAIVNDTIMAYSGDVLNIVVWSSSEFSSTEAKTLNFFQSSLTNSNFTKSGTADYRAIRTVTFD